VQASDQAWYGWSGTVSNLSESLGAGNFHSRFWINLERVSINVNGCEAQGDIGAQRTERFLKHCREGDNRATWYFRGEAAQGFCGGNSRFGIRVLQQQYPVRYRFTLVSLGVGKADTEHRERCGDQNRA